MARRTLRLHAKQLQAAVKMDDADGEIGTDPRAFVQAVRARHGGNAKIVIVVSKEPGLAPVLASPYEYWSVMDAAWVEKAGGDAAVRNDRMGKRIYQALGHCVGAGYRIEREAVMRYTPEPEGMDDCLSHGFHPLNSQNFDIVRRGIASTASACVRARCSSRWASSSRSPPRRRRIREDGRL